MLWVRAMTGADRPAQLEELAVAAALETGRFIRDERPADLQVAQTKSSATDVVTVMDQRAEQLLRRLLGAARPDDAFLGEEEGASAGGSGITWVIDPIDGTVNYLYDLPGYCVSVAAVTGDPRVPGAWRPVAGAVCNPVAGEVFHAHAGGGARLTRMAGPGVIPGQVRQLRVNPLGALAGALVGTGFGYRAEVRDRQGAVAHALLPRIRDIRRAGSAAVDLCSVAAGRLDAYYESGLNPWDLAAGWLIAAEAGALVTGLRGSPPTETMVVAAGGDLHPALLAALEELCTGVR